MFLPRSTKSFLLKMEKKLKGKIWHHFWTKVPMYNCTWASSSCFSSQFFFFPFLNVTCLLLFFFLLLLLLLLLLLPFIFIFSFDLLGRLVQYSFFSFLLLLFFFWFRCDLFIYLFYGHDFYFLINLGDWFFFLGCLSLFCFNWASFFNKSICINLYKLTFSIPPFFHSQPNKKEGN